MTWETLSANDGFLKLDNSWVRMSRIESFVTDDKRWGTTSKGEPLYSTTVTLISGATFKVLVKDPDALVRSVVGAES